jgi:hypothetical protein
MFTKPLDRSLRTPSSKACRENSPGKIPYDIRKGQTVCSGEQMHDPLFGGIQLALTAIQFELHDGARLIGRQFRFAAEAVADAIAVFDSSILLRAPLVSTGGMNLNTRTLPANFFRWNASQ